jgi:hypothetical protein
MATPPTAKPSRRFLDRELARVADAGGVETLRQLLAQGADPLAMPKPGRRSALHAAARSGMFQEARLLAPLSDLCARDAVGHTPLMWAAIADNPHVCSILLIPGHPSLETRDGSGRTALHLAASCGSLSVLFPMLRHCRPDALDDQGADPLMNAFLHRELSCAMALVPFCDPRRRLSVDGSSLAERSMADSSDPALAPLMAAVRARCDQLRLSEDQPVGPLACEKSKCL